MRSPSEKSASKTSPLSKVHRLAMDLPQGHRQLMLEAIAELEVHLLVKKRQRQALLKHLQNLIEDLKLDVTYQQFDLESTKRERDAK